jgi:hypothetical protein
MAYTFYQYLAFIQPDSDADLTVLKNNLESFYEKSSRRPNISQRDKVITVDFDNYKFEISLSDGSHVIEEAAEIANDRATDYAENNFDKEKLRTSSKRFEISGEDDIDMDYFNDSLFIVETTEKFRGVIVFDVG